MDEKSGVATFLKSEASHERNELRAKRVTSEASINQLVVRGAL